MKFIANKRNVYIFSNKVEFRNRRTMNVNKGKVIERATLVWGHS